MNDTKFDYKIITIIVSVIILLVGLFVFFKGVSAKKDYNQLMSKLNAEPQVTYNNSDSRTRLTDKRSGRVDEDGNIVEIEPSVVYELDDVSKSQIDIYTNANETISSFFDIVYTFASAEKYESRAERAIPFITENLYDSSYLKDGITPSGVSIVDLKNLESSFVSAVNSFGPVREDGMMNVLSVVSVTSSAFDEGEVDDEYYFNVLYNSNLNKIQNFEVLNVAELNPFTIDR